MDENIPYVAAAGASFVAGLIMWWAFGRFRSLLGRGLFIVTAIFLGLFIYFVIGIALILLGATSAQAGAAGSALGHGIKILTTMLLVVVCLVVAVRGQTKTRPN